MSVGNHGRVGFSPPSQFPIALLVQVDIGIKFLSQVVVTIAHMVPVMQHYFRELVQAGSVRPVDFLGWSRVRCRGLVSWRLRVVWSLLATSLFGYPHLINARMRVTH